MGFIAKKKNRARQSLIVLIGVAFLAACSVPSLLSSTFSQAGLAALSAPGVSKSIDDAGIMLFINRKLLEMEDGLLLNVSVSSLAGRVMLTGTTSTQEVSRKLEQLSAQHFDVRRVFNFLFIGTARSRVQALQDAWIASKLRVLIIFDGDVSAVNFNISVHRGVVYIQGIAPHIEEAERVVNHARNLNNVRAVELVFETIHEMRLAFDVEQEISKRK